MEKIKVYKFGGASVRDAEAVRNVANILSQRSLAHRYVVVISAMGKTTNALEAFVKSMLSGAIDAAKELEAILDFHRNLAAQLLPKGHSIFECIQNIGAELYWALEENQRKDYDFEYDQVVGQGEMLSTQIVAAYLAQEGIHNQWLDVRNVLITTPPYRAARVDWQRTQALSEKTFKAIWQNTDICITQGFIGVTDENYTTTLGREGSDYTAAILANVLHAESMEVWKDVPGVLTADPKKFTEAHQITKLSYEEAMELTFYGTSVLHPKTIQPLQQKQIPLRVRSFTQINHLGTLISAAKSDRQLPCLIHKSEQTLVSLNLKSPEYIQESQLKYIFGLLEKLHIRANMIQLAPMKFSFAFDHQAEKLKQLIQLSATDFEVVYNLHCELLTIKYFDQNLVDALLKDKKVLLEQKSSTTFQTIFIDDQQR